MTHLSVTVDKDFPLSFEGFIFNDSDQIKNQLCESHSFHLTDYKTSFARFILFVNNDEGKSPFRAPFGSFEFDPTINYSELKNFISIIEDFCISKGLKSLSINSYPFVYASSNSQLLTYVLTELGFKIKTTELNFHLNIEDRDFAPSLHESESRRLKKCLKENFQVKIDDFSNAEEIFELIRRNRESKGFPLSIKLNELKSLFEKYPGKYFAFTLRDGEKLIASSMGVKVSSSILYYFLPAANPEYKNFSPTVLLINEMYKFCRTNKYQILDLGIATAGGISNPGLIRFKENLGAHSSLKLSFIKEF